MSNCLVLGANGFLGSHLVENLINAGYKVKAFDRYSSNKVNFKSKNVEIVKGDFLNRDDIRKSLNSVEFVFHFISTTTPASAENDPLIDIETNVKSSINLFQESVNAKVTKVIFASTGGAIYGSTSGKPIAENTLPQPISPYAIGKLTIEHYLRYFERKNNLKSLIYRISNPYGDRHPLNSKQGVINVFLENIFNGQPITILGDGSMIRDYIYVDDVAKMITASFKNAKHNLYNLGSGIGVSVNEIKDIIETVVNKKIDVKYLKKPDTFIDKIVLNSSLYKEEFNITPKVSLINGIKKTWQYTNKYYE